MEWITKEEIARRGKISPYEAFTVSIEKYEQWLQVSEEELQEAIEKGRTEYGTDWCGCCYFYYGKDKGKCPLQDDELCGDCCKEWESLSPGNKDSIRAMLCRLYQERDKLPKEEKKPEPLKDGDFGGKDGQKWIKIRDEIWWISDNAQTSPSCLSDSHFFGEKKGNLLDIFTDPEALKEPLERAEFTDWHGDRLSIRHIDSGGCAGNSIELTITDTQFNKNKKFHFNLDIDQAPDFILKLRRLVTEAKRKQKQFESIRKDC